MGQAQSDENSIPTTTTNTPPPSTNSPQDSHGDHSSSPSMDSLLAEAAAYGEDENENEGSDCVHPFVALQSCMKANPDAFAKSVTEDEKEAQKKEEQPPVQDLRIIPPLWAKEPPHSNKSKL